MGLPPQTPAWLSFLLSPFRSPLYFLLSRYPQIAAIRKEWLSGRCYREETPPEITGWRSVHAETPGEYFTRLPLKCMDGS